MSFRVIMLLKNREAVFFPANTRKPHFKFGDGIYVITETDIQNAERDGKILGAEGIYFEGNPNIVGHQNVSENSGKYLDEIVKVNALKQTGSGPRFDFTDWLSYLAPLKDPINLMYILFVGIIAYGLLAGALGWV
jgi:hypothetical protein